MKKNRVAKIILFVAVICLLFQMIPADLSCADNIKSHAKETRAFINSGLDGCCAFLAVRLTQKASYKNISIKSPSILFNNAYFEGDLQIYSFLNGVPFDYRRDIRKCIPHYFHGSKYKI